MATTPQSKGGKARAEKLSAEQRAGISRAAALIRWKGDGKGPIRHSIDEGALNFAGMEFRCAVLDDETRVISGTEFMRVMGIYRSGALSTRRSENDGIYFPLHLAFKNLETLNLWGDRAEIL
jgi:hypothetical protein